jgi:hypothetical protein
VKLSDESCVRVENLYGDARIPGLSVGPNTWSGARILVQVNGADSTK